MGRTAIAVRESDKNRAVKARIDKIDADKYRMRHRGLQKRAWGRGKKVPREKTEGAEEAACYGARKPGLPTSASGGQGHQRAGGRTLHSEPWSDGAAGGGAEDVERVQN